MTAEGGVVPDLRERVTKLAALAAPEREPFAEATVRELLDALERGEVRAAERDAEGSWRAVPWVKRGILLAFRAGRISPMSFGCASPALFHDVHLLPPRMLDGSAGIRLVPGGSAVRRGAHVAAGVVCMPPMYINVGAHVGAGTLVDSHALVGSCAQVGERVHLSAAAQIGGVLEPVNATPVIVEDDVFVGGGCGVYEGTIVRRGAVLAAGVVLSRGTPVFDLVHETMYRAQDDAPLEIPAGAVVVPGARRASSAWGRGLGLSIQAPVIVKYRDAGTSAATALEQWLR